MQNLQAQKPVFIALSSLSIAALICSFGFPLQRVQLYRQVELSAFKVPVEKVFILTENDRDYPWGFDKAKAKGFAQIHEPATLQKILLLTTAIGCSVGALLIGNNLVAAIEYEEEINRLTLEGKKELSLKAIKQKYALANKSQSLLFYEEMKALMEEFGSAEQEMLEADEINALYAEVQGESAEDSSTATSSEESFRGQFPEAMDGASWRACLKALGDGASKEEIIRDVLGGGDVAAAYFDFLKGKFL